LFGCNGIVEVCSTVVVILILVLRRALYGLADFKKYAKTIAEDDFLKTIDQPYLAVKT
jgi:hypothetical protein